VVGEKTWKVVQLFTILHLLQLGHPMLEYESLGPLLQILAMLKKTTKNI
jgi:hypothetical protein